MRTSDSPDCDVGLNNRCIGPITVIYPVVLALVTALSVSTVQNGNMTESKRR